MIGPMIEMLRIAQREKADAATAAEAVVRASYGSAY